MLRLICYVLVLKAVMLDQTARRKQIVQDKIKIKGKPAAS
jgi:hypothetical protein